MRTGARRRKPFRRPSAEEEGANGGPIMSNNSSSVAANCNSSYQVLVHHHVVALDNNNKVQQQQQQQLLCRRKQQQRHRIANTVVYFLKAHRWIGTVVCYLLLLSFGILVLKTTTNNNKRHQYRVPMIKQHDDDWKVEKENNNHNWTAATKKKRFTTTRNVQDLLLIRKNDEGKPSSIVLPWSSSSSQHHDVVSFLKPEEHNLVMRLDVNLPDYGKLSMQKPLFARRIISEDDEESYETYRRNLFDSMDKEEPDMPTQYLHTEEMSGRQDCYRPSWSRNLYPVCNRLHEIGLERPYSPLGQQEQEYEIAYRGQGFFREAWSLLRPEMDRMVMKTYRFEYDVDAATFYQTQREAIVMEQLTHSPRIIDIYGLCGMAVLVEEAAEEGEIEDEIKPINEGYVFQTELDEIQYENNGNNDVHPMNDLTVKEKLDLAIVIAESVADLHGFHGGTIVHGDIDPAAWMRNLNGQVKLIDINLAEILDWNPWTGTYCPAEYNEELADVYYGVDGDVHDEGADVFAFGFILYSLLTGLVPYYDDAAHDDDELSESVLNGIPPYLDPRYRQRTVIESGLVKIMEQCQEFDMDKRISIFDVIQQLKALTAHTE